MTSESMKAFAKAAQQYIRLNHLKEVQKDGVGSFGDISLKDFVTDEFDRYLPVLVDRYSKDLDTAAAKFVDTRLAHDGGDNAARQIHG